MTLAKVMRVATTKYVMLAAALIALVQILFPHAAFAASATTNQTFEIKIQNLTSSQLNDLVLGNLATSEDNSTTTVTVDPTAIRAQKLADYLSKRGPRFVAFADVLAQQPHYQKIVAIAFAESTLGQHCYGGNNCWGITYSTGLARYKTLDQGIVDANRVLNRYSGKSFEQMCGIYVQPCNRGWLSATNKIAAEMNAAGIQ